MDIIELVREMNRLPKGTVVYKNIKGKKQPYLQWSEGGKTKSRYIKKNERDNIIADVERRKYLKEEFDRIALEDINDYDYYYVSDNSISYSAFDCEQALISKKKKDNVFYVNRELINSKKYYDKFTKLPVNNDVCRSLYKEAGRLLELVDGKDIEKLSVINRRTGERIVDNFARETESHHTGLNAEEYKKVTSSIDDVVVLHNHSLNHPPSGRDIVTYAEDDNIILSLVLCHDGDIYAIVNAKQEVIDIYNFYLEYFEKEFEFDIARSLATMRINNLNKNNCLFEIWRL